MSSTRPAPGPSSGVSLSGPPSGAGLPAWEDDAWGVDSDDDEFVKANNGRARGNVSVANNSKQKHAPPARPHPFPISSAEQQQRLGGQGGEAGRRGEANSNSSNSLPTGSLEALPGPASGSAKAGSSSRASSWMFVERSGSGNTGESPVIFSVEGVATGSALETGAEDEKNVLNDQRKPRARRKTLGEDDVMDINDALQSDLDRVLQDPTEMLSRLSVRSPPHSPVSDVKDPPAIDAVSTRSDSMPTADDGAKDTGLSLPLAVAASLERKSSVRSERRRARFAECLAASTVNMDDLRRLAWAGVPENVRPVVWMLLLGYLPPTRAVRASTMARKRAEYQSGVRLAFQRGTESLDQAIWHQIHIDVPRTNPGIALWQREATQKALERILYVWAIRHPASGYVQGINDLATPFFEVFLSAYITTDPEQYDVGLLPPPALEALEADTFWCLSKLLDGIQDNYIFAQPGIQRQVRRMSELVARINPSLHAHLEQQGVEYMQFAFRWMNCLLMREMSVRNIVRMWDTYLAEGTDAFSEFHLFVCSVFLDKWSSELCKMDFQGIIMFLQSLPTQQWSARETELLLSDAFVKKSLFGGTAHLTN